MKWQHVVRVIAAWLLFSLAFSAGAATRNYTLYITAGTLTINGGGGATMAAWGYTEVAGSPKFPGPTFIDGE